MSALQQVEWGECMLEARPDAALEREAREVMGAVPRALRLFAPCPWLARAVIRFNFRGGQLVHVDYETADLVFLAVSQDNSCRYCYASQRAQMRILGFEETRIQRLEQASFTAEADPRLRLALDFARRISRSNPPPGADEWRALREARFGEEEIKEIASLASFSVAANRITTLPALPLDEVEGLERRWLVRLLRPLIARKLRSKDRRGQPETLPPELRTGPFSYVHLELDGLPIARLSYETFDAAWDSPILPKRAKGLVFAVVARGLASARAEHEARALLEKEGLGSDELDEVLAHLASPALDPIEAAIVPFARATIWYRPIEIQRRARELLEQLSPEQLLELIGVSGLANAICRLSLVLVERR